MSAPSTGNGGARDILAARWLYRALTVLVAIVMFAMMSLTTLDVAGRALFSRPIKGAFEINTFLLAILIFSSLPLITWDDKHISVSLFEQWIPAPVRWALSVLLSALSTAVVAGITHRMWIQGRLMAEGQHITGFLEWPIAPIAYFMSVLSGLTTVILIVLTWHKLTGRQGRYAGRGGAGTEYPGAD